MVHPLIQKLSSHLTLIACLAVFLFYGVRAYYAAPSLEQTRYHSWLSDNRDRLLSEDPVPVQISVRLVVNGKNTEWSLESRSADEAHNRKLARLLELAETSEIFLYEDVDSPRNASMITVRANGEEYTALLGRKRIERTPALSTFLRLSRLYAEETTAVMKESTNANS